MAEEEIKDILNRPRPQELSLFEGQYGRELSSFVRDVKSGARVSIKHMDFFFGLAQRFVSAARPIAWGESMNVSFDDNYLAEGSHLSRSAITVSSHERFGKTLYTLDNLSATASSEGLLAIVRPYPIHWHLDHISQRSRERQGTFDPNSDLFLVHNNVVMMMLRIIEEEHYTGQTTYIPFILPERNGLLLGHTMKLLPGNDGNRIFMAASKDVGRLGLSRYQMFPQLEGTVRTFLGPDQMTSDMQRLRMQLLKYYNPPYREALGLSLDSYTYTEGSNSYDNNPRRDLYEKALLDISDIMASPLWQKTVKLPVHLRSGRHPSIDLGS